MAPHLDSGGDIFETPVKEALKNLMLDDDVLKRIMTKFRQDVEAGLKKATQPTSAVKCYVTYVQDLPTGSEKGRYLALDLGGTNFRVLLIELCETHFEMKSRIFAIPKAEMVGPGDKMFDHIAECLATFLKQEHLDTEPISLGFTFSFPCQQVGLTKGILIRWTKGFQCSGVEGNDVVQLLREAIARRGDIKLNVTAILNDTTGTLMSCAWRNRNCKIGLIIGTGTNACYVEKQQNAEFFDEPDKGSGNVIINTEWGAFGDDGGIDFCVTDYDREIDKNSINPGKQLFEKMISGMYMGELARLIILKFTKDGLLFGGKSSPLLEEREKFETKFVSDIEGDLQGVYTKQKPILQKLGLGHATDADMMNIRFICEVVSRRAAGLVSATLAALLNKMGEPHVTIGVDGSVYRFHPYFHGLMMHKISELVDPGRKFDLMLSEDGSGRGAALVAAVAAAKDEAVVTN
ncbi:hexokinase type 2-like isoform X2 [Onthophagus taurus]|uniref:hexokinase type 2-like isoform X2 n=1 Tax=Onthophagus taurus TaxID=166361 RepID=UPI0039BE0281